MAPVGRADDGSLRERSNGAGCSSVVCSACALDPGSVESALTVTISLGFTAYPSRKRATHLHRGYILGDIVQAIYYGDHFEEDLEVLRAGRVYAAHADMIEAFLAEVDANSDAMWKLIQWDEKHAQPYFNCKAITWMQDLGFNVYRLRPLKGALRDYRLVYAYRSSPGREEFEMLAIGRKPSTPPPHSPTLTLLYDYEKDHPITKRICDEYERRGFPKTR